MLIGVVVVCTCQHIPSIVAVKCSHKVKNKARDLEDYD